MFSDAANKIMNTFQQFQMTKAQQMKAVKDEKEKSEEYKEHLEDSFKYLPPSIGDATKLLHQ